MMKWILYPVFGLLGIPVIAYLVGLTRDPALYTEVSIEIARPPEAIYPLIADPNQIPKYYPGVQNVEIFQQNPLRFRLTTKEGTGSMEIATAEVPRHIISKSIDQPLGISGVWDTTITPSASGSRIDRKRVVQIPNPLMRSLAMLMDTKTDELKVLEAIKRYAESH